MKLLIRRLVSCTAVAALLFAQLAVAAFACPGDLTGGAPAAMTQAMPGCDGMGSGPAPLCASHCADGAKSFEKPAPAAVVPAVLVGSVDWPVSSPALHARADRGPEVRAASPPGPPLPIRNCCLRI